MHKILSTLSIATILLTNIAYGAIMEGGVTKNGEFSGNQVIDSATSEPVSNATVTLPMLQYKTYTDKNGTFHLGTKINGDTIMSVEKDGYRPYSITINEDSVNKPLIVGIEKSNATDISLENNLLHLGDNNYSKGSANSGDFKVNGNGPMYTKTFKLTTTEANKNYYLVIGSIIGIDTKIARSMGQNRIRNSYSSPPEIFLNGEKIAEIHINGDGQKIKLPYPHIKSNQENNITIKTGKNMTQSAYTDYDDIELINLSIVSE